MALGVGFAVANSSAVAHADTDSDASASPGSENDSEPQSGDDAESSPQGDGGAATGDGTDGGTDDADLDDADVDDVDLDDADLDADEGAGDDTGAGDDSDDLAGEDDTEDPIGDEVEEPVDAETGDDQAVTPVLAEENSTSAPVDESSEEQTTGPSAGEGAVVDESSTPEADEELTHVDQTEATVSVPDTATGEVGDLVDVDVLSASDSVVPLAAARAADEAGTEEVDLVTTVVSSVLSPFADPAAPAPTPWFDALLAWVRRQITHTFFNESPEWGPIEGRQVATGQVLFDLNAWDPNGDPLTYKISQPKHGLVVRDPLSGEFIYTPTTVVTGEPLTDSFKVVISDSGEHLKGLAGLIQGVFHFVARAIGLAEPDEVALMVNVTVNPIVEVPPVIVATPAALGFNREPILVSPVLVITDLDSESLSSATVTIGDADSGDVLDYDAMLIPDDVSAEFTDGVLTFTGSASVAQYQQLLASVTLTAADAGVKTVSFRVVDAQGNPNAVPAATVVTVLGVPGVVVAPVVVATPVAAGITGSPVVVSPVVVITDLDSESLSSATVTVDDTDAVLGYDSDLLPEDVVAELVGGALTFTGSASKAEYQQLLASVTLTSDTAGVKSVSFSVVDAQGNPNVVPAATVVTVVGVPGAVVAPVVVATPVAAGITGSPVVVSPVVVITDLDSESLSSATVTVDDADAVLGYDSDLLPEDVVAELAGGVLSFTGAASKAEYQQLLASVTLTSDTAGVTSVSFSVVDAQGNPNVVPAATVVTVVGVPGAVVAPVVVATPVAAGVTGAPVMVSPIVVITDLDSESLSSATVTVDDADAVLGYDSDLLPEDVVAELAGGVLSFTGAASKAEYQQLLASVTLTSDTAGVTSVSFSVVDAQGNPNAVPAATVVTVLGVPGAVVAPVVVATPVAAGITGSPVVVSPVVVITDLDSESLSSATVTVDDADALLGYDSHLLPEDVVAEFVGGVLSFTGSASKAEYQQLLASVTLTAADSGIVTVSFSVVDAQGSPSVVPAATVVTVVGVPGAVVAPVVVATPVAAGITGAPVVVSPLVLITDLDSESLSSATVTVDDADAVLGYDSDLLPGTVSAGLAGGVLTFTGAATKAQYQQLLASVTLTSDTAGVTTVSFSVVDEQGNASAIPAGTVVTVVGVPGAVVAPVVVVTPVSAGTTGSAIVVSPVVVITDLDSESLSSATVTVDDADAVLSYDEDLLPGTVSAGFAGGVLTFTGSATKAQYQQLLASVTLSTDAAGVNTVSFTVVDATGTSSVLPANAVVTVVGLPTATVAPVVVATPVAGGTANSAIVVSPVVVITDLDSESLSSATVTVDDTDDVLSYDVDLLPNNVSAELADGTLTFTGLASVSEYQQLLASVTLNSDTPGVKNVSFAVIDSSGVASTLPALTLVTVLGIPASQVAPVVVVAPAAAGTTGVPVTVSPVLLITDVDSTELSSASVTLSESAAAAGDVLGYDTSLVPQGVAANFVNGVLTFTGAASVAQYQQLLASVSMTAASAGIKTVAFAVVDASGTASALPAATVVTVLGLPTTQLAPVVVAALVAAGTTGSPVVVSPVVLITDVDSTELSSATVSLDPDDLDPGDVLNFDAGYLPDGVVADFTDGVLTFNGVASLGAYQQLLASVTLLSSSADVKTVGFAVVDDEGRPSTLPAQTLVTLLGVPLTQVAPVVVATPVAAGTTGSAIVVSPIVVITDLDSESLSSATVTVDDADAVLGYGSDLLPEDVVAELVGGVLTFTGAASKAEYQQLLASVTLSSDTAGVKTVSFSVVDAQGNASAIPAVTVVTVLGVPGAVVAPVVVATPVAAGMTGAPVVVSPIVVITDLDSESLSSATVTVDDPDAVLGYDGDLLPGTVSAGLAGGVLSFTGSATKEQYEQLLASVTLTSDTAGVKTVSFVVTDSAGSQSALPALTAVTVVGVPGGVVAPVVVATPVAAGVTGAPVVVSPTVVITDLDSDSLSSATVTVDDVDSVLGYDEGLLPGTVSAGLAGGVLSFTGSATKEQYEQLLASVTLTSDTAGVKTISFSVTDAQGNPSAVPAATLVTVVGVPGAVVAPVVVATPVAAGITGAPVMVSPIVVITDLDSESLSSATVTVDDADAVLSYDEDLLPGTVSAGFAGGVLTFTGAASKAEYQQLLASVTLTSDTAGVKTVSFVVTDSTGSQSALPALTAVTVVGVPGAAVAPVVVATPVAAGTTESAIVVSPIVVITDLDSESLSSATVTVDGADAVLSYDEDLLPGTVSAGFAGGVLTFTGAASKAEYQQLLASVTLTSDTAGVKTVSFVVTDSTGSQSALPALTAVTVVGAPGTAVAPVVVATPVAAGTTDSAIVVSPLVVITDLDSESLSSATVTVDDPDVVLGYDGGLLPGTVSAGLAGGVLSFTGSATKEQYEQLLASITLSSDSAGVKTVSFSVVDAQGNASAMPAVTVVTVVGVPGAVVAPVVVATPVAAGTTGSAVVVSPIVVVTDLDSESLSSATVTVDDPDVVLGYDGDLLPGTVSAGLAGGVLSFTGSATKEQYEQLLASVTLTSDTAGVKTVSFVVTDGAGSQSALPALTAVTVVGVPGAVVAPVVVATPVAAGITGAPVVVSPIVVITDLDSESLSSATVTVDDADAVLSYDEDLLPGTVSAGLVGGVLTFTGAASKEQYEQLLASVTLTSDTAGVKTVSFVVTDSTGSQSVVPALTAVTVVGAPSTQVAPVVVATPVAAGTTGSVIVVSPIVVITDLDSESLSSATVTVDDADAVLEYDSDLLPGTVSAGLAGGVLSFTGSATKAQYQQLLASVTLTSDTAGVKTVSFVVTDSTGSQSVVPALTAVTVVGAPSTQVAPVVVATPVAAGTTESAILVSPIVLITDLDSLELLSAAVSLDQDAVADGDTLDFDAGLLPPNVEAEFVDGVLTFTGQASISVYQQLLSSVTISAATAGVKTVNFSVTDSTGTPSTVPMATLVTVLATPTTDVSPVVVSSLVNVGYSAGGAATPIDANLIILDLDSESLKSATVTVGGYEVGDDLSWGSLPDNVEANLVNGLLTFTGTASVADYQQLLRSVSIATNADALTAIRTVQFRVVDEQDNQSAPAVVAVTVTALPAGASPLVLASVVNVNYSAGGAATPIDANLIILDLDSDSLQSATVTIGDFETGDELTWGTLPQDVSAEFSDGVLTFTGNASLEDYQQLLRSVSIETSSDALTSIRSIAFQVTDAQGQQSLPGVVAVTVVAVPQSIPPLVVPTIAAVVYTAGSSAVNVANLLNLIDVDSQNLSGATITLTGGALDAGETLSFTPQSGISGVYSNGVLTLNGTATVVQYQAAIRSVTFSTNSSAEATIRTVSIVVTDAQGSTSLPGSVAITVLAAPTNLAPLVATSLLGPVYTAGNDPEIVDSLVTIIDLDSTSLQGATVQITQGLTGTDVLAFTSPSGSSISGTYVAATGTLTLSGTATVAQYREALRSVTFATDGSAPTATRTIAFSVTDAQGSTSAEASATVSVQENAAPILTPSTLAGSYSNLLLGLQLIPVPLIVDTSSYLEGASVTLTNPSSNDNLSVDTTGSTIVAGYAGGVLSLSGQGTVAEYQSVLNSLRFRGTFGALTPRQIEFVVTDMQGASSNTATLVVTILL